MTKTKSQKARARKAANGGKRSKKGVPKSKGPRSSSGPRGPTPRPKARPISAVDPNMLVSNNKIAGTYFRSSTSGNQGKARGCELIGSITVNSTDTQGTVEFQQNIAPQFLTGTRLSVDAARWEKYRYNRSRVLLVSKCGNTTNGSMVAYIERDVAEPLPTASFDSIQKGIAHWGSQDIPLRKDGSATMMRIPDENPYFTDPNASDSDPEFGQGRIVCLLNSTGATVVSGGSSLTVYDVLWEYDCDFWIPQLTTDLLEFYVAENPNGSGISTTVPMGAFTSGGSLPITIVSPTVWAFTARAGCFYKGLYTVTGTGLSGCSMNFSSGTVVYAATSNSATPNICFKIIKAVTSGIINVTLTPPTALTTTTLAMFEIVSYGAFDPTNPSITSKRKSKGEVENAAKLVTLESQILDLRKCIQEMALTDMQKYQRSIQEDGNDNEEANDVLLPDMKFYKVSTTPAPLKKRGPRSIE